MTELYLIIPAVIIFALFLPVILELKLNYNLMLNTGVVSLSIYKKNVLYYIFEIKGNTISLKNEEETIEKKIELNSPELEFFKHFGSEIREKVRIRFLTLNYNIGLGDAFLSSMVCGYINSICLIIFSYLKNKSPTTSLALYDTVSFNKEEAVFSGRVNISISLFDFVYSLLLSVILTLKSNKNKKSI